MSATTPDFLKAIMSSMRSSIVAIRERDTEFYTREENLEGITDEMLLAWVLFDEMPGGEYIWEDDARDVENVYLLDAFRAWYENPSAQNEAALRIKCAVQLGESFGLSKDELKALKVVANPPKRQWVEVGDLDSGMWF